jgi:hypothetical protein
MTGTVGPPMRTVPMATGCARAFRVALGSSESITTS